MMPMNGHTKVALFFSVVVTIISILACLLVNFLGPKFESPLEFLGQKVHVVSPDGKHFFSIGQVADRMRSTRFFIKTLGFWSSASGETCPEVYNGKISWYRDHERPKTSDRVKFEMSVSNETEAADGNERQRDYLGTGGGLQTTVIGEESGAFLGYTDVEGFSFSDDDEQRGYEIEFEKSESKYRNREHEDSEMMTGNWRKGDKEREKDKEDRIATIESISETERDAAVEMEKQWGIARESEGENERRQRRVLADVVSEPEREAEVDPESRKPREGGREELSAPVQSRNESSSKATRSDQSVPESGVFQTVTDVVNGFLGATAGAMNPFWGDNLDSLYI